MASLAGRTQVHTNGRQVRLTKNDRLVLTALEDSGAPLKAYDLLERLKAQGIGAPMTVYRALDRLQKQGLVHKLDGLGAFMICRHGAPHAVEAFLVCGKCEHVEEVNDTDGELHRLAHAAGASSSFTTDAVRIEIRGSCAQCRN